MDALTTLWAQSRYTSSLSALGLKTRSNWNVLFAVWLRTGPVNLIPPVFSASHTGLSRASRSFWLCGLMRMPTQILSPGLPPPAAAASSSIEDSTRFASSRLASSSPSSAYESPGSGPIMPLDAAFI